MFDIRNSMLLLLFGAGTIAILKNRISNVDVHPFGPGAGRRGNRLIRGFEAGSTPAGPTCGLVEQSGVLATLTWWRSLVQIQPGLLKYSRGPAARAPLSHRGKRRFESCREYYIDCGVDWSLVSSTVS